jgi:hypothetical protein
VWLAPAAVLLFSVTLCLAIAGRPFVYPLDDSYIHLAIGRTLAQSGTWGIQPQDAAAASSSPLWTLILATVSAVWPVGAQGVMIEAPLALNIVFACALAALWSRTLADRPLWKRVTLRSAALLLLWLIVPLTPVALLGMEHVLHLLLATALLLKTARSLSGEENRSDTLQIGALAALAVACRYESLFLVAPLGLSAVLRRRWATAIALAIGAAGSVMGFGWYWIEHGGWLFPNPLLVKSNVTHVSDVGWTAPFRHLLSNLATDRETSVALLGCLAAVLLLLVRGVASGRKFRDCEMIFATCSATAAIIQLLLGSVNWLFRYEAWLIGILGFAALQLFPVRWDKEARAVLSLAMGLLILLPLPRAITDFNYTVMAIDDRRHEHVTVADFLRANYTGKTVVLNDIGMPAYFSGVRILDIYGLGSNRPVEYRRAAMGYGPRQVQSWASTEGAKIAILQICWGEVVQRLPASWQLVEVWDIPRNTVFHDRSIGFFSLDPRETSVLADRLRRFPLRSDVRVRHPSQQEWLAYLRSRQSGWLPSGTLCRGDLGPGPIPERRRSSEPN